MNQGERQDAATYRVVVDHEKQYTVYPVERALPRGSWEAGKQGSIMECLAYIEQTWERLRAPAEGCASADFFLSIPRPREARCSRNDTQASSTGRPWAR
ncbi:MbtH family NRPS accessory protein [Sorangium sp. So ce321]|uniref:MbtH family NRPS accessory protein n=1 Tax=Sorangium sp. So ce321 TaxID=3133300 RepID=UPI003F643245